MAQEQQRQAFIQKLGQFRATLSPDEQRMLDAMVMTAEGARPGDVEGYSWFFGNDSTNPSWYTGSTDAVAPGQTSGWWQMYSGANNPFKS